MDYLTVGVLCLDEIYDLDSFPEEDTKCRAKTRTLARGGSAANVAFALRKLLPSENIVGIVTAVGHDSDGKFLLEECSTSGIDTSCVIIRDDQTTPKSVVLRVKATRTIIHHRDLDEVFANEFIDKYQRLCETLKSQTTKPLWIHFEGRNTKETSEMMKYTRFENEGRKVLLSLELERARTFDEHKLLLHSPDVVVISQSFMKQLRFDDVANFFENFLVANGYGPTTTREALWIVTMGEKGSVGAVVTSSGVKRYFTCPAENVADRVVDSLGAGDTFLSGVIFKIGHADSILLTVAEEAVKYATTITAEKIQRYGLL
jgi:sugar/nucleoside kinase (ribokinase family)